jgi:hypothetical protein
VTTTPVNFSKLADLLDQARYDYSWAKSSDNPVVCMQQFMDKHYMHLIDNYQFTKESYTKSRSENDLVLYQDSKWWRWQ